MAGALRSLLVTPPRRGLPDAPVLERFGRRRSKAGATARR
ncbi:MAG: hypothetical protein HSCHL_1031 [Hydrogenibacillus schlegelii]|uniref:Uncharacterized protein n=1 Tax=Hydrogenibacillus schlegelii TaxID=1484 RepID=A0A2T5G6Q1_HYDSH|nr:MAG: hypothetical protein HSCHL_1031 [Hydrogenibacillus schlegelii]